MSIPTKVRIGYREYTIKISQAKKAKLFGSCDIVNAKIVVNAHQDRHAFVNTLLHEALHAISSSETILK